MRRTLQRYVLAAALAAASLVPLIGGAQPAAAGPRITGAVYTMTNETGGNRVAVFLRDAGGRLHPAGKVATGGTGTGAGLGSQGGLAVAGGGRWLLAVNAGSNSVSALKIGMTLGVTLVNTVSSGGTEPVSVTVQGDLAYVVNAGSDDIRGFRLGSSGLHPVAGSMRPLSGTGVGPAEISFGLAGRVLVVTEKNTNLIDTFRVNASGKATGSKTHASAGQTPFGFVFAGRYLVPTEAFGGAAGESAVSSYAVTKAGDVQVRSSSVPNGQSSVCWAAVSPNRRDIFVANTGSNTVSRYSIDAAGLLRLREAEAGTTGAAPADETFSPDGRFLYVLNGADGTISAFRAHGVLSPIDGAGGLPAGSAGGLVSV
jgi:VCBS repeat-containing protein